MTTDTEIAIKTAQPQKRYFHCRSCNRQRPLEQLGKIITSNRSKRCKTCCDNAAVARALIAKGRAQ